MIYHRAQSLVFKNEITQDYLANVRIEGKFDNIIVLDQYVFFLKTSLECQDTNDCDEENSAWPTPIDDYIDHADITIF